MDGGRLAGMLADMLSNGMEDERRLLLLVLSEGLPRRMLAGETAEGALHGWASQLAGRFFIQEDAILAAMQCWRDLLQAAATADAERERCLEAVRNYGRALNNVPDRLIDREMCLEAGCTRLGLAMGVGAEFRGHAAAQGRPPLRDRDGASRCGGQGAVSGACHDGEPESFA